ncbi:MAG: FMN-binding protein [Gammaproteobacteria bacterium]|nr:FMN-binding protein [Gammaproteobacteria bacterium]
MNAQPIIQAAAEPSPLRLVLTLTIAGLLAGIIIIGIYEATLPTITANKKRALEAAVSKVLSNQEEGRLVSKLQKLVYTDDKLLPSTGKESKNDPFIYGGYDAEGKFVGYAIKEEAPGFQDTIKLLYGYLPDKELIVGMEVLESLETPGLGDKIYKDMEFVANFRALAVKPKIVTVKKGTKSKPNEVDAITGATISSKAVVKILNKGNAAWLSRLPAPGTEPSMVLTEPPKEKTE